MIYLEKIELKNFLSFEHLIYEPTKKFNIIFGENGSGKTNLVYLFRFLNGFLNKEHINFEIQKLFGDVQDEKSLYKEYFKTFEKDFYENFKRIGIDEPIQLNLEGRFNEKKFNYKLQLGENDTIIQEEFRYASSGKGAPKIIFKKNIKGVKVNIFGNKKFNQEIELSTNNTLSNSSFISVFRFKIRVVKEFNFNQAKLSSEENEIIEFLEVFPCNYCYSRKKYPIHEAGVLPIQLIEEVVELKEKEEIKAYKKEILLFSEFVRELDTYIDGVELKEEKKKNGTKEFSLINRKKIEGKITLVPFEFESDGTKKFTDLYNLIQLLKEGYSVIYDEIENGFHEILVKKVLKYIKTKGLKGQFIGTTHAVNILNYAFLNNDEKQIINRNPILGGTHISNLCGRDSKENNTIYYLNGAYGGAPTNSDLFFEREE